MLFFGAQYHQSGPVYKKNKLKGMICKYYNHQPRCYGNLRFRVVKGEVRCDLEHLACFRVHSDHCEYAHTNPLLRALGKPEFGMYRGGVGCEILNAPPVPRPREVPRPNSPEPDESTLSAKSLMMRAIGLKEVRRRDRPNDQIGDQVSEEQDDQAKGQVNEYDDRSNGTRGTTGKISKKELELQQCFRTVKKCLDEMMWCLDDMLGCGETANTSEQREDSVRSPPPAGLDVEEAGKFWFLPVRQR